MSVVIGLASAVGLGLVCTIGAYIVNKVVK